MDAFKCNSKELTTNSLLGAKGHQSFGMHMPSSSLHQSCDSVAHRVSFTLCCSSHKVLSAVFFGLSSRFFCLNMTCHTLNSILASLESQGHTLSTSKSAPTNTSVSTSSSFLSPASVSISAEAHSQGDFLSISAVAPAHVSSFSGERRG